MITPADSFMVNNDKFISSGFGDEMMLMNLETGDYIGLNNIMKTGERLLLNFIIKTVGTFMVIHFHLLRF